MRVHLCMGWRGVGGVKVCVIEELCQKVCKSFYAMSFVFLSIIVHVHDI